MFKDKYVIILDYCSKDNPYFGGSSLLDCYSRLLRNWLVPYTYLCAQVDPFEIKYFLNILSKKIVVLSDNKKVVLIIKNRWLLKKLKEIEVITLCKILIPGENKLSNQFLDKNQSISDPSGIQSLRFAAYDSTEFKQLLFDESIYVQTKVELRKYSTKLASPKNFIQEINNIGGPLANFENLLDSTIISKREILGGNSSCGYTRNIKKNTFLNNLEMPNEVRKMKGCSFCSIDPLALDKNFEEKETVRNISQQILLTIASNEKVNSFISNDQLFLLYAESLCIKLKKSNEKVNIYLESRVSFLLQHQEKLTSLLELLQRTEIQIILHLIGFENFSQEILDRFNKGLKVQLITKLLELLNNIEKKYPNNFKASTGSHGYILFTPWTTFLHLKENLNIIQKYNFERYCGHLHLRRLRLAKNIPLFYLAKEDKLLTSNKKKDSYAMNTGYSHDIDWKFQDKYTEYVYLLCKQLHVFGNGNPQEILAKAIEQVENLLHNKCRFDVKIECELSQHCLNTSISLPSDIKKVKQVEGNIKRSSKMEYLGLEKSLRQLVKFEGSSDRKIEVYEKQIRKLYKDYSILKVQGSQRDILFIAKSTHTLEKARNIEIQLQNSQSHSHMYENLAKQMSELLGYPSCCTEHYLEANNFLKISSLGDKARVYDLSLSEKKFFCPLTMRTNLLVSYFSCKYSCNNAIQNSKNHLTAFIARNDDENLDANRIENLFYALNQKVLYFDENNYFTFVSDMLTRSNSCIIVNVVGFPNLYEKINESINFSITETSFEFSNSKRSYDNDKFSEVDLNKLVFAKENHLLIFPGSDYMLYNDNSLKYRNDKTLRSRYLKNIYQNLKQHFLQYETIEVLKSNITSMKVVIKINEEVFTVNIHGEAQKDFYSKINESIYLSYQGEINKNWKKKFLQSIVSLVKTIVEA